MIDTASPGTKPAIASFTSRASCHSRDQLRAPSTRVTDEAGANFHAVSRGHPRASALRQRLAREDHDLLAFNRLAGRSSAERVIRNVALSARELHVTPRGREIKAAKGAGEIVSGRKPPQQAEMVGAPLSRPSFLHFLPLDTGPFHLERNIFL